MAESDGAVVPPVTDEEILYRSIWLKAACFYLDESGKVRVAAEAFADKSKQVSLFRHNLCDAPPRSNPPRLGDDQAVASLLAGKIREQVSNVVHKAEKEPPITYLIDVVPDVSEGNTRHTLS